MKYKQKFKGLFYLFIPFLLLVVSLIGGQSLSAYAYTSKHTSVLEELQKDETFNIADYPYIADDYSVYVIQIAESEDSNLYVFTYQPCQKTEYLIATHINMSLTESINDTNLYGLTLVSSDGVFCKYLVKGVTVSSHKALRYYNISSIYRNWIKGIDDALNSDNIINEKAFFVGKLFTVTTSQNGSIVYNLDPTYVIKIINPVSSYVTVENSDTGINSGLGFGNNYRKWQYTDLHYVAFSTDWDIDRLISATVHYSYCSGEVNDYDWLWWGVKDSVKYGDVSETTVNLECTESYDVVYKNLWSVFTLGKHTYTWDKIYSTEDFCNDVSANTSYSESDLKTIQNEVKGSEWVLLFTVTERKVEKDSSLGFIYYDTYFTKVDEVSVLRLEFESDGIVYNLGTVCDTVSTPYPEPDPDGKDGLTFWEYLWYCIVRLFKGTATGWEGFVAVSAIVVGTVLISLLGYAVVEIIKIFK